MVLSKTKRNLKKSRKQKKTRSLKRGGAKNSPKKINEKTPTYGAVRNIDTWEEMLKERNGLNAEKRKSRITRGSTPPRPPSQSLKP
jgi:hypothetical protein